jgi:3-phenylpropionate/trans-cinnamate dioxygenase ferredoxin subunit
VTPVKEYRIGRADAVPEGQARVFEIDDQRVAVCRVDGRCYALQDVCTHDDGPLGEGRLEGHEIICPRHGARFDVRTGAAMRMPAVVGVETFVVREENGELIVEME